jgi:hypothetical protein
LATLLALHQLGYPLIGIDDANIFFVYARNLADGHGFVYNVGGERVEGFTSLLWTLIAAFCFKYFPHPELTLLVISIVLASMGTTVALGYLQSGPAGKETGSRPSLIWSAVFLILLFTSPRYVVWNTITLMENALWSVLLLVTTVFVISDPISVRRINSAYIPLAILLILTRPESILWVAVFTAILFIRLASGQKKIHALKSLIPSAVCILTTLALLALFRLKYFGYPLPNTYYAKVSPSIAWNIEQGAIYLILYLLSDPISTIGIFAVIAGCLHSILKRRVADSAYFLPFIGAIGLVVPVLVGGDHFGSFRSYQNVFPIIVLCIIQLGRQILPEISKLIQDSNMPSHARAVISFGAVAILALGLCLTQIKAWGMLASEIQVEFKVAEYGRANGVFAQSLFASLPKMPSIGVIASGGIKYSYKGEIVDLLGLNNTVMAHNQGDRTGPKNHAAFEIETFYKLQPDIVWPILVNDNDWEYNEVILRTRWENISAFKGLFNDPQFLEMYSYAKISEIAETTNKHALVAWFKKDLLQELKANADFLVEEYEYSP